MNPNLVQRIITSLIAGTVVIAVIVLSPLGVWLLCSIASMLALTEFMRAGEVMRPFRILALALLSIVWLWLLAERLLEDLTEFPRWPLAALALLWFPTAAILALFRKELPQPMYQLGVPTLGLLYLGMTMFLFYEMTVPSLSSDYQFWQPLGILIMLWTLDSMAYFAGRFLGKRPLFPRVSPKKTWEGAIGGTISCLLMGLALQTWAPVATWNWLIIAAILAVFAQVGDLIESMFKRSVQLKDSGDILPGHGGMLDRFDGLFFSIPILFLYWQIA